MFSNSSLHAAGLVTLLATSALAQDSTGSDGRHRGWRDFLDRSAISIAFDQTRPQGELAHNIGVGYGANAAYLYRLDAAGVWSIRADVAAAAYGNESSHSAFSETVGGRVQVNTRTTNYIVPMFVGPQVAWTTGVIQPYMNAGIGAQTFVTESAVEDGFGYGAIASSTNQVDATLAWVAGGGVRVPIVARSTRAQLDFSMQYVHGGRARYLAPGSITDLPGGNVSISAFESATHLIMLRAGARIGL
jgi:hypothetical protein